MPAELRIQYRSDAKRAELRAMLDRFAATAECARLAALAGEEGALQRETRFRVPLNGTVLIGATDLFWRDADGLHLPDVCGLCIDNHVPVGDASVEVCADGTKAGPVSSVASMAIANAIVLSACQHLREKGLDPEVFRSGNCPGGDEYNARLIQKFSARVRSL